MVPRHEQGPSRIARPQQLQRFVERGQARLQIGQGNALGMQILLRQHQRQLVAAHAHAACFVHRRGAAFELPCHPQREANRGQGEQQENRTDRQELRCQTQALRSILLPHLIPRFVT